MTHRVLLTAATVAFIALSCFVQEAQAACNAVPDALNTMRRGPNPVKSLLDYRTQLDAAGPVNRSKLALGTIDIVDLNPSAAGTVNIRPDGICVNTPGREKVLKQTSIPDVAASDILVSFLFEKRGGGPTASQLFGSKELCARIAPQFSATAKERGVAVLGCSSKGMNVNERENGKIDIDVDVEALRELVGSSSEDGIVMGGSVTVVAIGAAESTAAIRPLLDRVATEGCASACGDLLAAGGLACGSKVYARTAAGTYQTDPMPCAVNVPPNLADNKFGEQCDDESTAGSGMAPCGHNPDELVLWVDDCGGIHIPFDWSGIRRDDQGNDTDPAGVPIVRELAGRSAAARETGAGDRRIWIPGREFVGSTPKTDPNATLGTTDWRLPDLDVWYPAESPESLGLLGTVDKDQSILHLYPRMPVRVLCDTPSQGSEACMQVGGRYRGSGIECACRDGYAATCTCKTVVAARYFACSDTGSPSTAGQPCTRQAHCNPTGKCNAPAFCVKEGDVWHTGPGASWPATLHPCWDDDDCATQPGGRTQCGFLLFNFVDRIPPASVDKVVTLDAVVDFAGAGARTRRGVCKEKRSKSCRNHPDPAKNKGCLASQGDCRGYTLRAGPQR